MVLQRSLDNQHLPHSFLKSIAFLLNQGEPEEWVWCPGNDSIFIVHGFGHKPFAFQPRLVYHKRIGPMQVARANPNVCRTCLPNSMWNSKLKIQILTLAYECAFVFLSMPIILSLNGSVSFQSRCHAKHGSRLQANQNPSFWAAEIWFANHERMVALKFPHHSLWFHISSLFCWYGCGSVHPVALLYHHSPLFCLWLFVIIPHRCCLILTHNMKESSRRFDAQPVAAPSGPWVLGPATHRRHHCQTPAIGCFTVMGVGIAKRFHHQWW